MRNPQLLLLSLAAGILILLGGIFGATVGIIGGTIIGVIPGFGWLGGLIVALGFLGLIFGILVIVGAVMINSGGRDKVKTGSIIVLIFSILSLFAGGTGGFCNRLHFRTCRERTWFNMETSRSYSAAPTTIMTNSNL
ncbi:MAG: hypothetical protein QXW82_07315 [Candidatus Bathyarchaeia archaeon]